MGRTSARSEQIKDRHALTRGDKVVAPVRKAIFPLAGLGTRLLPATKSVPKEMLPVLGKPMLQYAIEEARSAGIEQFIFVTGQGEQLIVDHFAHNPGLCRLLAESGKHDLLAAIQECEFESGQLVCIRQPVPRGLGHAVWCARAAVGDEPFAVVLADDLIVAKQPCLSQMMQTYQNLSQEQIVRGTCNLLGLIEVDLQESRKYGMVSLVDDKGGRLVKLAGLVEKPAPECSPSNLAVIGRYILQPEIIPLLAQHRSGTGGEIQLTDAIAMLLSQQSVYGLRFAGRRFDCGSRNGLLAATLHLALAEPETAEIVQRACTEA